MNKPVFRLADRPATCLVRMAACLAAFALLVTFTTRAEAQRGFVANQVDGIELRAGGRVIWSNPTFLSPQNLCRQVYAFEPDLKNLVSNLAGVVSAKLPRGITLVRHRLDVSRGCSAHAAIAVDQISLNVSLPRNIFFTSVTTPNPLGPYADPKFSADFDVTANTIVKIPATPQAGLQLGTTRGRVFNIKPDGQNLVGDLTIAVARFVDNLGDLGFAAKLAHGFDLFQHKGIKLEFDKLTNVLKQQGGNARIRHSYESSRRVVVLEVVPPAAPNQPRTVQQNEDRPGSDYLKFAVSAASECEAACGRNTVCRAWTWVKPGVQGPNAQCYLKKAVPKAVVSSCCTSGVKATVTVCPRGMKGPNCDEMDVR